ncbi:hypothetical protein [Parafilimonas sp.]|uniref:hypothetical protein n=1 Tax=Parafilimonas sp. TaxID=1969739 RepID=UPI0039E6C359
MQCTKITITHCLTFVLSLFAQKKAVAYHSNKIIVIIVLALCVLMSNAQQVTFTRFKNNPIITAGMLPSKEEGDDINGPCLIEAPNWLPNKLGKYYLYFAHHKGKYIRLAYADDLKGPWNIYKPGALHIEDCICNNAPFISGESIRHAGAENAGDEVTHIASPDVLVDDAGKQLILYFHCPLAYNGKKGQYSLRAVSSDGIHFKADSTVLGDSYFRVFKYGNYYYSLARTGIVGRSGNGIETFERGNNPFDTKDSVSRLRHVALKAEGNILYVFYSRIGDAPERILLSTINLDDDWLNWKASAPIEIAAPATAYEGADLPITKSKAGLYYGKVRQLRDPYVYAENNKWYLLYSAAGENAIAIGELKVSK